MGCFKALAKRSRKKTQVLNLRLLATPFGHPTQVNASWVTSINLLLANEIQDMSASKCEEMPRNATKLASPLGHPTAVSTQVQLVASCDYLRLRLARALGKQVLLPEKYEIHTLCFISFYSNFVEMKEMTKRNMWSWAMLLGPAMFVSDQAATLNRCVWWLSCMAALQAVSGWPEDHRNGELVILLLTTKRKGTYYSKNI